MVPRGGSIQQQDGSMLFKLLAQRKGAAQRQEAERRSEGGRKRQGGAGSLGGLKALPDLAFSLKKSEQGTPLLVRLPLGVFDQIYKHLDVSARTSLACTSQQLYEIIACHTRREQRVSAQPTPKLTVAPPRARVSRAALGRALSAYASHPKITEVLYAAALFCAKPSPGKQLKEPHHVMIRLAVNSSVLVDVLSAFRINSVQLVPFSEIERQLSFANWDAPGGPYRDISRQRASHAPLPSTIRMCGIAFHVEEGAELWPNNLLWTGMAVPGVGFSPWDAGGAFGDSMKDDMAQFGGIERMVMFALNEDDYSMNRQLRLEYNRQHVRDAHCLNCLHRFPGQKLRKCSRCLQATYCSERCQKADWRFHKLMCAKNVKTFDYLERVSLSDRPINVNHSSLRDFVQLIDPDLLSFLYAGLKLLTPEPLHETHTVVVKVARAANVSDPSLAYTIVSVKALPHRKVDDIIPGGFRIYGRRFSETVSPQGLRTYWGLGLLPQHLIGMAVYIDVNTEFILGVPLSFSEAKMLKEAKDDRTRLSRCGARVVDFKWAERLKERASISAVDMQPGVVPTMTKREYARWCEGADLI